MGRGVQKKKRIAHEIEALKIKRRNGMMRLIAAIVAFVVVTAVKEALVYQGFQLASDIIVNGLFFMFVVVMAGVAGWGSRDYMRANNEIRALEQKRR